MPFVQAKCTNCGANLEVDNSRDAAICPYCHTPYVVEKAINKKFFTEYQKSIAISLTVRTILSNYVLSMKSVRD